MLNVVLTPHREFLPAETSDQRLFMMLKIRPTQEVSRSRPSTTFAFVIDTSGSMYEIVAGNPQKTGETFTEDGKEYERVVGGLSKIDVVMDALHNLIHSGRLTQADRLCLIQFDDRASTLIGLTPATDIDTIEGAIAQLQNFSGGTCLGKGMNLAINLLNPEAMTSRRTLIFTDGATFDEDDCYKLAQQFSSNGIPITALGVGDYNEGLLVSLSDTTGGRCFHVVPGAEVGTQVSITNLPQTLFQEFEQVQREVINNLALNIRTVQGVTLTRITRVYPDQAELPLNQTPYPLGAAIADDQTIFILEFKVENRPSSRVRIAQLGLTYDIPGLNRRGEFPPQDLVVQFVAGQGNAAQVDQEVMGYVQQRNISQLVDDATRLVENDPEKAENLLETARRLTVKIGNQTLLESLNEGIEELRKTRKISSETRKTVKMGSRGKTVKLSEDINEQFSEEQIRKLSGT